MDRRDKILQIIDNSGCLSKRQFDDLLHRNLHPEELRAVELHLASCTICSDAVEGFENIPDSFEILKSLKISVHGKSGEKKNDAVKNVKPVPENNNVKKETGKPAEIVSERKKIKTQKIKGDFKHAGIALGAIGLFVVLLWSLVFNKSEDDKKIAETIDKYIKTEHTGINEDTAAQPKIPVSTKQNAEAVTVVEQETVTVTVADNSKEPEGLKEKDEGKSDKSEVKQEAKQEEKKESERKAVAEVKPESFSKPEKLQQTDVSDYENALTLFRDGKYASALLYFQSELTNTNSPKYWDAMYYSALCHKNMNNKQKATIVLQKIIDAKVPQSSQADRLLEDL